MPRDKKSVSFPTNQDLNLANEAGEANDLSGLLSQFREAQGCLSAFLMGGQETLT